MDISQILQTSAAALGRRLVRQAFAHCDTEDGPAVVDGVRALQTGNVNIALKWVQPEGESEIRDAFERAGRVRALGGEAAALAERWFLESLVRVHRAGEGAGFDGIKPTGTHLPAQVVAADAALEQGTIDPLRGLIDDARWPELERRFEKALELKDFDEDDLTAARAYVHAYVSFFKFAEGEDHEHHHGHHGHHGEDEHQHGHAH